MGNCCLEMYAVFSKSEYEVIPDEPDDRCRAHSNVTSITYQSDTLPLEDDGTIFPPQFSKFYQMGSLVGVGTTSKVYQVHPKLNKKTEAWEEASLACKIINKQRIVCDLEDQDVEFLLEQLGKEVDILKRIKHQNIVQFYDYMETKDRLFIITERLRGGELFEYILNNGPLSEAFAREILFGVFSAVAYLHERGVVHRDIKAENLIFFRNAHGEIALKLIDFGFSTVLRHSMTGSFMGTGGYIAPEIRQNKNYSTSVDSWSLGVLLYCTLAARLPFGISLDQLPGNLDDCRGAFELQFPSKTWDKVSAPCKDLISKLLEIDPNRRFTVKEALSHPWFQAEYRREKFREASQPTRSLSSDTLAEAAQGMEFPVLRPRLRPTLSMSAIERRGGQYSTYTYRSERTSSVGDYDMLSSQLQDPSLSLAYLVSGKAKLSTENVQLHSKISASAGAASATTTSVGAGASSFGRTSSSGSGCTSSADGLTDTIALSAAEGDTAQSDKCVLLWEDAHSPLAGELFYSTYQQGSSSPSTGRYHTNIVV